MVSRLRGSTASSGVASSAGILCTTGTSMLSGAEVSTAIRSIMLGAAMIAASQAAIQSSSNVSPADTAPGGGLPATESGRDAAASELGAAVASESSILIAADLEDTREGPASHDERGDVSSMGGVSCTVFAARRRRRRGRGGGGGTCASGCRVFTCRRQLSDRFAGNLQNLSTQREIQESERHTVPNIPPQDTA